MSDRQQSQTAAYMARYLRGILEARTAGQRSRSGQLPSLRGGGHIAATLWADAPWRLEPDQDAIPFTFIVRDAAGRSTKMHLDELAVYEAPDDGQPWEQKSWSLVERFTQGLGAITRKYWTYRPVPSVPMGPPPMIPLSQFTTAVRGRPLLLKVVFRGSHLRRFVGRRPFEERRYLLVYLASESLPLHSSAQWYYGDTHHHTSYTNDIKEFGNPVPDTRAAAECIGLDWLVTTDHSCDLTDQNPYWEDRLASTRWDSLGVEVQANSDDRFRLLRGEEVTVLGIPSGGDDTLHLLVMGPGLLKLIPGAWATRNLLAEVASLLSGFAHSLYKQLFGPIYSLEAVLTGVDPSGKAVPALVGSSVQAQGAVAFAAHPATFAQAPGGTWEFYDLLEPIQGMEAWNGRVRRVAIDQESPFDHWKYSDDWDSGADRKAIGNWDLFLRRKVASENPRFVLVAGSDAHGSFNYSEGWWMDWDGFRADDDALGRPRTLLYLPLRNPHGPRRAPTEAEVAEALRAGSCVATDGPALNLIARFNGNRATLGQTLAVDGAGTLEVDIQAASTAEFGAVDEVVLHYFVQGMEETAARKLRFSVGESTTVTDGLPAGPGYVRLTTATHNGQETFRCFTNPVWFRSMGADSRTLRANFVAW